MLGGLSDFKPHHRLQASDRLIKLDSSPEFTGMVREHTRGGDLISQFLISAVTGRLPDFQPCHRMEAMRQLAIINPKMARALAEDNTPRRSRDHDRRSREGAPLPTAPWAPPWMPPPSSSPTSSNRRPTTAETFARFFIDVMQGTRTGFNQHFRFSAAEVLINRGYDVVAALCPDPAAHAPQAAARPLPRHGRTYRRRGRRPGARSHLEVEVEWTHFEYPEDRTYDFSIYGEDEYDRDTYGHKAPRAHIRRRRDQERRQPGRLDYKVDQIEAQRGRRPLRGRYLPALRPLPELSGPRSPRRRLLRTAHLRLQRPRLHIRRQGRSQGRLHSGNDPQEEAPLLAAADAHDPVDQNIGDQHPDEPPERPPPKPRNLVWV